MQLHIVALHVPRKTGPCSDSWELLGAPSLARHSPRLSIVRAARPSLATHVWRATGMECDGFERT